MIDPGDAGRFTLALEVVDPAPYPRYRLRVVEKGGEEVWRTDELVIDGRWLRLDLPAGFLEPREYELLIDGLGSGSPRRLAERYTVKLKR